MTYSIADIERLSGIKAHTLRVWEKRYAILNPSRSLGNTRMYHHEDLMKVQCIVQLREHGYKISSIAKMCMKEMETEIAKLNSVQSDTDDIDTLVKAVLDLDEYTVNTIIDHYTEYNGYTKTMDDMIYPLLEAINMMLMTGGARHVHELFLVGLIRRKLICAIDNVYRFIPEDARRFLLYLPEGETHELSLLYVHLTLLKQGVLVLNLGESVSLENVSDACAVFKPDYVFTMFNEAFLHTPLDEYVQRLSKEINGSKLLVSGFAVLSQHIELPQNVETISDIMLVKSYVH